MKTLRVKWERLSVTIRVAAGLLSAMSFFVGSMLVIGSFERGGFEQLLNGFAAAVVCGMPGIVFGLAAITGCSPDLPATFAEIISKK